MVLCWFLWAGSGLALEQPQNLGWHARIQDLTGKGPDGLGEIGDWRPLSFYGTHSPSLHFGPSIEWTALREETSVSVRSVGAIDGLGFWEVKQDADFGENAWDQFRTVLLLAGPQEDELLPVHILNSDRSVVREISPMAVVRVGGRAAIRLQYAYEGMGGHRAEFSYVVHEGRPLDLEIDQALLQGDLPPAVAESWVRFVPKHHRWVPPEWEAHTVFDDSTLRGYLFLTTKAGDRFCWFEAAYQIMEGRLRLANAELSDCPPCNESCRAGEPWAE